jgi:hypothetical protein
VAAQSQEIGMPIARTIRLLTVLAFAPFGTAVFAQGAGDLAGYVGRYSGFAGSPNYIDVTAQDGILRFQPNGQSPVPAAAQPDGKFRLGGGPIEVEFHRNNAGAVEAFTYTQGAQLARVTRVEVLDAQYAAAATTVRPHGLSDAVLKGDLAAAKALIDQGIDLEELDTRPGIAGQNGRRPLNWAALRNDTAMLELLLGAGADINSKNLSGFTPVHHAVEGSAIDALQLLIAKGADLTLRNGAGLTPLDFAVAANRTAAYEVLKAAAVR